MRIPVAIFAYNRPKHLEACLKSILQCEYHEEFSYQIFVDGPKSKAEQYLTDQIVSISQESILRAKVQVSEANQGLSRSIISGVTQVLNESNMVIVIEDDLILHQNFLSFMSLGLRFYENIHGVSSIQGYSSIKRLFSSNPYFLLGSDCWGWGTWKNRWESLELNSAKLYEEITAKNLSRKLDLYGGIPHTQILQDHIRGKNDSWAIRWHVSNFLAKKVSLHPPFSLVQNIGDDGSGVNMPKMRKSGLQNTSFTAELKIDGSHLPKQTLQNPLVYFHICLVLNARKYFRKIIDGFLLPLKKNIFGLK